MNTKRLEHVQAYFESEAFKIWFARIEEMRKATLLDCAMNGHDVRTIPGIEGPICVRCGWQETDDEKRRDG